MRLPHAAARVAAALGVFAALAGCSGTDAVRQDVAGSAGFQIGDDALTWVQPGDRHAIGDVRGQLLDGTPFDLSGWRGHVVVVNFWGAWCAPCQQEAQFLEQVFRDEQASGVEFVGIDIRDNKASAAAFLTNHHITYPTVFDPSNVLALRFPDIPPNATPTTIVLDRQGRIAARQSGSILYTQLRAVVRRVLAEKT